MQRLHPVSGLASIRAGRRDPGSQAGKLMLQRRRAGLGEVVPDQTQVQVPALRTPVGPLDPRRDDIRVARPDDPLGRQPVQAGAHGPLRQAGVPDERGHRRECAAPVRPGVVGQAHKDELAGAGRLPTSIIGNRGQVERPRHRLDTHRPPPAIQPTGQPGGPYAVNRRRVRFWERNGSGQLPSSALRRGRQSRADVADLRRHAQTGPSYSCVPCSGRSAHWTGHIAACC
jgi:hypothetical protein